MNTATTFERTPAPRYSPWGPVQQSKELAPGIWQASTAGHGGIILSQERLAAMPAHLKINAYGKGPNFEEDCEWALVCLAFPEAFSEASRYAAGRTVKSMASDRDEYSRRWLPVLEKHPPLSLSELSRATRIELVRYEDWNNTRTEEEAAAIVDSGQDLQEERV